MKKMLSLLIALILATACFAAFAEEEAPQPQPVPDPDRFGGVWECDRAVAEIVWEEEGYRVMIHWSDSAWEKTTWEYSCYYYEEENKIVSTPFGIRTALIFDDNGELTDSTVLYDDGIAEFTLDEEGKLIWKDEKEDAGKDMKFEWVSEYVADLEEEDDSNG